jgi:eukaryotic-like serine/threonine-protein kinase
MGPGSPPSARSFADRFELKSQAGSGGMGTVYQAIDRHTQQVVAVKILHGKGGTDAARFDQEAALLAELRHPGIVRYVDHGITSHGESYIAMEWLSGETLEERLMRGPLPAAAVARLGRRVLESLAAAHERGIVHRDIKPSNIFLVDWRLDDTRILDFGIARRVLDTKRFTKVGSTVGTPMYTAPEQARGDRDVDGRADVFSLGSVLFEALAGEPPFTGETPMEVMAKICIGAPPRLAPVCPGLPPQLEKLIESMLKQDRRERPADAGKLADHLSSIVRELGESLEVVAQVEPPEIHGMLSDGEQRVMCALMIAVASAPKPAPEGRMPPRKIDPSVGETSVVMPTVMPSNETGAIEKAVEPFGGHVDKLLDRSLLVTLPARGQLREQAAQIARCALALRSQLPGAAMAIATGRAALLAKLPVGPLIDQAGALLENEKGGVVRIDEVTARLLPARFQIEGSPERRLVGESESDDRPRQIGGRVGPFVGRDRELSTLVALFRESAEEGVPRAALVLAGAGAGKTRLRQEFLASLEGEAEEAGVQPIVLRASGELVRSTARYQLLGGVLARAGIDTDWAVTAQQVQDAWVEWLRARCAEGPVLLVLEEMQWADLACVQLVDTALRLLKDQSLFVLAIGRPEVEDQFPGLWNERAVERLRLPPLGRKSGQTLVKHFIPGVTPETEAFVLDRWDGNPFFLEELVEAVLSGKPIVPETVLGVVEARFEELEPEIRRVARAASVFGDESFSPEGVVALVGEKSRRELNECLELLVGRDMLQRFLNGGETAYRFRNRLVREAAYRMLPTGDRALARRLARAWLENAGKTLPEFLVVALSQSNRLPAAAAR